MSALYSSIQLLNTHLFYSVHTVLCHPVAEHSPVLQCPHCTPQSSCWTLICSAVSALYSAIHLLNTHLFYSVYTVLRNPVAEYSHVLQWHHCTPIPCSCWTLTFSSESSFMSRISIITSHNHISTYVIIVITILSFMQPIHHSVLEWSRYVASPNCHKARAWWTHSIVWAVNPIGLCSKCLC